MKWRRKNASLITHVFPASWFSKFKQKKGNFEAMSTGKAKQKVQEGWPSSSSSLPLKEGRFYCGNDDPDWRLSFGDEGTDRPNSAWDHEPPQLSIPNSSPSSNMEPFWMFNNTASDVKIAKQMNSATAL